MRLSLLTSGVVREFPLLDGILMTHVYRSERGRVSAPFIANAGRSEGHYYHYSAVYSRLPSGIVFTLFHSLVVK